MPFAEAHSPIDGSSVAGYVALTGTELVLDDVYRIPSSLRFRFNPTFDEESGYRCKSMLAVPMKNPHGEITGVVQLINCKRDPAARVDRQNVDAVVVPYSEQCRPLLRSLASQAAVAIENIRLYESIETLFEGFVRRRSRPSNRATRPLRSLLSRRRSDRRLGPGGRPCRRAAIR